MWFIQIIVLCNVIVFVCAAVGKELSSGDAVNLGPQSLPLTGVNSIPVFSDYWTSFLNISYVDTEQNVWHTEKTDTARFVVVVTDVIIAVVVDVVVIVVVGADVVVVVVGADVVVVVAVVFVADILVAADVVGELLLLLLSQLLF